MAIKNRQEPFLLFLGDMTALIFGLYLALLVRYRAGVNYDFFVEHLVPFSFIILISIAVFLAAGLYEKHTSKLQTRVPATLLYAQLVNAFIAISFFYLLPYFGITPKTTLFMYLLFSTVLLFAWRVYGSKIFAMGGREKVIIIGEKSEVREMVEEIEGNDRYGIVVDVELDIDKVTPEEVYEVFRNAGREEDRVIVAPSMHPKIGVILTKHYDFILSYVNFLDIHQVYEQMFDRVPMQAVDYYLLSEASRRNVAFYDILKRIIDVLVSVVMMAITFPFFPLVALAVKLDSKGPVFIVQKRVGKRGQPIDMYKFRTMTGSDDGVWLSENTLKVTRVGYFLRKSRIDELPQLINVIRGDISLIGPRPDIVGLGERLVNEIPYYMTRYAVLPGLSGWAQIEQRKPPQSLSETELRFSYDLFYVKNRSLLLDIRIALRTIKTLLSRTGM